MASQPIRIGNVEIIAVLDAAIRRRRCARCSRTARWRQWEPYREHLEGNGDLLPLSIAMLRRAHRRQDDPGRLGIGAKNRPVMPNGPPARRARRGRRQARRHRHRASRRTSTSTTSAGTRLRSGDGFVPTFPKAKHVFNRDEWEYWTAPGCREGNAVGRRLRAAAGRRRGHRARRRRAQAHRRHDADPDAGPHAGAHLVRDHLRRRSGRDHRATSAITRRR